MAIMEIVGAIGEHISEFSTLNGSSRGMENGKCSIYKKEGERTQQTSGYLAEYN